MPWDSLPICVSDSISRDAAVSLLRDVARQEREAHRNKFNFDSHNRADAFDRAADLILAMPVNGVRLIPVGYKPPSGPNVSDPRPRC